MPGDDDELGGGLDNADDFDALVNSVTSTETTAPEPPAPTPPTELKPPPEAAAEAKPKRQRKPAEAKPVPLKEPAAEGEEPSYDDLPESTKLEMEAGRAALAAKAGH